jgi:uncharacterized membrane protein
MAVGLFTFSMTAFLAIGSEDHVSVTVLIFAFAVGLVTLGLMRGLQVKAFASLQLNTTLAAIQDAGRRTIDELYPDPLPESGPSPARASESAPGRPVLWRRPPTTLEQLDLRALLDTAESADAVVVFRVGVGATLTEGATVAEVHGAVTDAAVVDSCVTGVNRTFDQDPLLAFRLLADIGLRALSPAVNDPATAAQTLDAIVGLLTPLAVRDLDVGAIASATGATRVWLHLPVWADFVSEGLDELLAVSTNSATMLARASTTLTTLAEQTPEANKTDIERRSRWVQQALLARPNLPTPGL